MDDEVDEEPILMSEVAGRMAGPANLTGGTLVLTPRRLVFVPIVGRSGLQMSNQAAKLSKALHDWPLHPQALLNMAIMPLTKLINIPLAQITDVTATRRCAMRVSWLDSIKPRTMEFAVTASRFSTVWNPENVVRRDQLLAAINHARS